MTHRTERLVHATAGMTERLGEHVRETLDEVKPKLRGWLHAASAPLTLAAGVVLVVLSPTASTRIGSAVFATSALVLFTVSGIYHRGTWSPRVGRFLRRFDHANIFLLIAGSYTPFMLVTLRGALGWTILVVIWAMAVYGVGRVFRHPFDKDPSVWPYLLMGWLGVSAAVPLASHLGAGGIARAQTIGVGADRHTGAVSGTGKAGP